MPRRAKWDYNDPLPTIPWLTDKKAEMFDKLTRRCVSASTKSGVFSSEWESAAKVLFIWVLSNAKTSIHE